MRSPQTRPSCRGPDQDRDSFAFRTAAAERRRLANSDFHCMAYLFELLRPRPITFGTGTGTVAPYQNQNAAIPLGNGSTGGGGGKFRFPDPDGVLAASHWKLFGTYFSGNLVFGAYGDRLPLHTRGDDAQTVVSSRFFGRHR